MTITLNRIAQIKAGTAGVTPGPWETYENRVVNPQGEAELGNWTIAGEVWWETNRAHIANCDPQTIERERHGWRGSRDTVEHLAEELADVVICADLCAITAGIDLQSAVIAKFNATSDKVGIPVKLAVPPGSPPQAGTDNAKSESQKHIVADGMVPREMTGEMWVAGRKVFENEAERYRAQTTTAMAMALADRAPEKIWAAMIAAAPQGGALQEDGQ